MPILIGMAKRTHITVGILCACCLTLGACRGVTPGLREVVEADWAAEDTAELCHYMFWPIPDPTASTELKLLHYSIMQAELDKRGVVCTEAYPDKRMYRGQSMLEKLLD